MQSSGQSSVFGRRSEPHTVIIARGSDLRHFTIRPWLLAFAGTLTAAAVVGYLGATTYLVLRDDLIGASVAQKARMQQAYEDRISSLRAQVDRITSRQLLDQQLVESKVGELLQRQSELTKRHGNISPVLGDDATLPAEIPLPSMRPDQKASLSDPTSKAGPMLASAGTGALAAPFSFWSTRKAGDEAPSFADRADMMFVAIGRSLKSIEADQMTRLDALAENAYETAEAVGEALESAGFRVDAEFGRKDVGGPLVPLNSASIFDSKVKELDEAVATLNTLRKAVIQLPIASPSHDWSVSSTFGVRTDPLLGTPALHAGMDFRAPMGAPIEATASGKVIRAGWNGGYGRMVEIDHGNGLTTRFAHMSRILVKEGDKIALGDVVGEVGSSGRSTGPHLHYEVRKNGTALDPLRFIKAGKRIHKYLASLKRSSGEANAPDAL